MRILVKVTWVAISNFLLQKSWNASNLSECLTSKSKLNPNCCNQFVSMLGQYQFSIWNYLKENADLLQNFIEFINRLSKRMDIWFFCRNITIFSNIWIVLSNVTDYRNNRSQVFDGKGPSSKFCKIHKKKPVLESLFNKTEGHWNLSRGTPPGNCFQQYLYDT